MTVSDLIRKLGEYDPSLPVCYRCFSEYLELEAKDITTQWLQPPRADGWVHDKRPDKPAIEYVAFPGN